MTAAKKPASKLLPRQRGFAKKNGGRDGQALSAPTGSGKTAAAKLAKYEVEIDVKVTGSGPLVPGDVVRLRGDRTQVMTIESLSRTDTGLEIAKCAFFRPDSGYLFQETIALAALVRVS